MDEFIKLNPTKYRKFTDSLKQKFLVHAEVYGKPNVLVNNQGFELGRFVNKTLSQFSIHELVEMAEIYSSGKQGQSAVMKKILEQIDRENNENEYNRTEV